MNNTNFIQKIMLAIPVIILTGLLLAFRPSPSSQVKVTGEIVSDSEMELFIDYIPYYFDKSKKLIRIVWKNEVKDVRKYHLEKSVNDGEWVAIAQIDADIMQPMDWNETPEENRFGRIMYSTDGGGGFIYNELMDNKVFAEEANFKFRVRVEKRNNTLSYSTLASYKANPPVVRDQGLRVACPSAGTLPKGACVTGTTTTACDCGGTYTTSTYVICDNAQACPDCSCSCQCSRDPCCQHSCGQASSCNCAGKWWSCDAGKGSVVTKVTTASCSAPSLSTKVTDVNCACTGAVDLTATSSCTPLSYKWSNGSTSQSINNVCAGTYTVTVTDNCGTTAKTSATVKSVAVAPTASCSAVNQSCTCDGSVSVTASGGSSPYSYLWSTGTKSSSVSSLCAGNYTVTVTDACAMTATCKATVGTKAAAAPTLSGVITDASCLCIGAVDLTASGGTPAYKFSWSNGKTTEDISSLCAGTYTVTVTDACSQTATYKAVVSTVTPKPSLTNTPGDPTGCNCDGSVSTSASGGTPGYTYKWSTGSTATSISGQCAGSYTVTVTDACGQTAAASSTLAGCTAPSGSTSVTDATCASSNGAVDLTYIAGSCGSKVKSYSWSSGATTEDITSLKAGTYTVTVTDKAGCTGTAKATVATSGSLPSCSATSKDCVDCVSPCDGSINLTPSGGTPGYTFKWSTGATTEDISLLCPGSYTVTITDAAGCSIVCDPGAFGYTAIILPIELTKFTAVRKDRVVVISWTTASETNSDYFTVERSQNGNNYSSVGKVKAAGNSAQTKNYEWTDTEPFEGLSYYRLKLTSFNSQSAYSSIIAVTVPPKDIFNVQPTLVQGKIEFTVYGENEDIEITILDVNGRQLSKKTFAQVNGINKYQEDVSSYANGTYYASMKNSAGVTVKRFVKY